MTNASTARWALLLVASVGTIAVLRFAPDSFDAPVLDLAAAAPALLLIVAACILMRNPFMHRLAWILNIALVACGLSLFIASSIRPAPVPFIDDPHNPLDQIVDGGIGTSFGMLELATADPVLIVSVLVLAFRLITFMRSRIRYR